MTRTSRSPRARSLAAFVLLPLLVAGCAGGRAIQRAEDEVLRGNLDTAIAYYQEILQEDPRNTKVRIALTHLKLDASQMHEKQGVRLAEAGQWEQALAELQLAVRLDPTNEMAQRELGRVSDAYVAERQADQERLTPTEEAIEQARGAQSVLPQLQPQVTGAIAFDFRDVEVTEIYRTLAQIAGLNVLFELDLDSDLTTFRVDNVDFFEAMQMLTIMHGHFYKALSSTTFLVIPDDVTKRRQYADQVMRTFYLSYARVDTVEQSLRALLQTSRMSANTDLNTITIRDTPAAIDIAERFIESSDKSPGEILLEVEFLEVSSEVVRNYGLALEPFSGNFNIAQGDLGISLRDLGNITSADIFVTVPTLFYQFLKNSNDFKLVAEPKLRAAEGETTSLLIGDRVPVVTTTFNPASTIGGNIVPISSTNYEDTGIALSVTPRVHFNREITLEIDITISAVTATATVASVGDLPVFTTRQIAGSIRLRDGETNVIAGLLQDNDVRKRRGIIGLADVPVLGAVFSNTQDTADQTDVVISITPHLIRSAEITPRDLEPIYVGTEAGIGGGFGGTGIGGVGGIGAARPGGTVAGGGAAGPTQIPAVLALLPAQHAVAVGEEFALDVTIDGAQNLFSAGLLIAYDPNVIEYVETFEGDFIDRDGAESTTQSSGSPGTVRIGMSRLGTTEGVSGSGSLVTLVFRAVAEGTTSIEITSTSVRNAAGSPMATQMLPATVEVGQGR